MDKKDYLLTVLAEECSEVIELCSKMMRFGSDNFAPDEKLSNRERMQSELNDIFGVVVLLQDNNIIDENTLQGKLVKEKKEKVEKYWNEYNLTKNKHSFDVERMFENFERI